MEDHILRSLHGLKGLADQVRAGLDQHLDGDIVRDVVAVDERPEKLIFRLGSGGEAHFDLLHPDIHQGVEELQLFLHIHRINQGLVSIPQVHGAPDGRVGDLTVGPCAMLHLDGYKGDILVFRIFDHDKVPPFSICCAGV